MALSSSITNENMHVLLVEHDDNDRDNIKIMLENFFKVTAVKLASTSISILGKEKSRMDLVFANMSSPDIFLLELLQDAAKRDLIVILMTDIDDANTIMWALDNGALFCIRKPITMRTVEYLWQHVLRENKNKLRGNERHPFVTDNNGSTDNQFGGDGMKYYMHDKISNVADTMQISTKKGKEVMRIEESNLQNHDNVTYKRKVWTEWTQELHDKFISAVTKLGEGRCYPKDILELMNVSGLTRMQVASHLQRCRSGNWLPPHVRKSKTQNVDAKTTRKKAPRAKQVRFGSMPRTCDIPKPNPSIQDYQNQQEATVNHASIENNRLVDTFGGSSNEGYYHPQFQAQPQNDNAYPFSHDQTKNTGQPLHNQNLGMDCSLFDIDEPYRSGFQNVATITNDTPNHGSGYNSQNDFDSSYVDCFSALEQELRTDYNGSLQALMIDQEYYNQILGENNASTNNQLSENMPKPTPRDDKESDGTQGRNN